MATSTIQDMKVYDSLMVGGYIERLTQNINVFNTASAGTIRLLNQQLTGDYAKESFFKQLSALSRRDDTSVANVDGIKLTMDEQISVKVKRKFGPVEVTRDSLRSQGMNPDDAAFFAGQAMADEVKQETLNTVLLAVDAALSGQSEVNLDVSGNGSGNTISHLNLNKAFALMGDKSGSIRALVMSGAAFHDLIGNAITEMGFNDSGISIYNGGVPTMGKPVIVTDAPALSPEGKHVILGLSENAGWAKVSEDPETLVERLGGKENIITRYQGESAYNIQVKGFKWDVQNGGRNPTAGAVATATNWENNVSSHKNLAGVRLVVAANS